MNPVLGHLSRALPNGHIQAGVFPPSKLISCPQVSLDAAPPHAQPDHGVSTAAMALHEFVHDESRVDLTEVASGNYDGIKIYNSSPKPT
ncbi:hypothetical protein HPB50_025844 [Hyalomma asiaticum]|uniref:Uncharacterized protein n=1 Tax=Hyalomma asiaticum TaxID=266040 RepID=A0ACB7TQY8_HYAAI|nr:hypothetical protein HPB50_025844 [Hyalomma asiaticum]